MKGLLTHPVVWLLGGVAIGVMYGSKIPIAKNLPQK
jgi:hypothetical protein